MKNDLQPKLLRRDVFRLTIAVTGATSVGLLLPGRPGSAWKREGPVPPRWRSRLGAGGDAGAGSSAGAVDPGGPGAEAPSDGPDSASG